MHGSDTTADEGGRTKVIFVFPGQGSYDPKTIRELYEGFPETASYFRHAENVAQSLLGQQFLPCILAPSRAAHDRLLASNPDVPQIGIYLAGVLVAEILMQRGLRPDLLVGHSIGELAALAASGVYSIESGLEIVGRRVLALRSAGVSGQMAAINCGAERAAELLRGFGPHSLEIAVVNHPKQTVLSGTPDDLARLGEFLARTEISMTRLESPFPFHSSLLGPAVEPFRRSLSAFSFSPARIPVYHCTEGMLFSAGTDLAGILSRQFVRRLDFAAIVLALRRRGFTGFVECGGGGIVTRLIHKNLPEDPAVKAVSAAASRESLHAGIEDVLRTFRGTAGQASEARAIETPPASPGRVRGEQGTMPVGETPAQTPVAIVGMGCVLPGAGNPDQFWQNIKDGIGGIVDDPAVRDFLAEGQDDKPRTVPDKTYSRLSGSIVDIPFDAATLGSAMSEEEFRGLTRPQKLLALALGQSLAASGGRVPADARKVQCILGATADGSSEFDDAVLVESLQDEMDQLDEPPEVRAAFARALEEVCGYRRGDVRRLSQQRAYRNVVDRFVPGGVNTWVVDSACASSLHALHLGVTALLCGESDMVLAGGVYRPGRSCLALFAQFRGLSATGCRPFDRDADGVIFSDGAGMLVLKRLPDALADGDRVIAVIRGTGLSSDGKSPAINVPQAEGQSLAIRRALRQSGIHVDTIQYIEAHATGTPVGDEVESASLRAVFGDRQRGLPRIELGSVKALIGHTGWAAGMASIIKVCKALQERTVPKQSNFCVPDPALDEALFTISTESHAWPGNIDGYPRRAGVSGFGFGGTNAHLVLEEFEEPFHRRLCGAPVMPPRFERLCVVGAGSLFPALDGLEADRPTGRRRFPRHAFPLPRKKMLLPDVTECMDASQFLVALATEKILNRLPEDWTRIQDEVGIVVGLESKTEEGVRIDKRILLDRLTRLFREGREPASLSRAEAQRVLGTLAAHIRRTHRVSGPYSLTGLMPSLAAGRTSSLFDLRGTNAIIDQGGNSLFRSLIVAAQWLACGVCKMVFAGGVNGLNGGDPSTAEAALILALTTDATAREYGFPILARLTVTSPGAEESTAREAAPPAQGLDYRGATGAVEILAALDQVTTAGASVAIRESGRDAAHPRAVVISSPPEEQYSPSKAAAAPPTHVDALAAPIYRYIPALFPQTAGARPQPLRNRRLLVLTDQPDRWSALRRSGALGALTYHTVFPAHHTSGAGVGIDLESEGRLAASIRGLEALHYDTVLAVQFLDDPAPSSLLERGLGKERGLIELLFAVCRRDYGRIRDGRLPVIGLSLDALKGNALDPRTGLVAGFMKALSRELPAARLAAISTDESNLLAALRQVENELGQRGGDCEVCYLSGRRHVYRLRRIECLARDNHPYLSRDSVVLATGGGRGVTAVLAEELLRRFGCSVVATGRTDPGSVPEHVCTMEGEALQAYEARFYRDELARDPGQNIRDLKRKFAAYQAANEVRRTITTLRALRQTLPGEFEYLSADLTDQAAVDRLIDAIYRRYGRIDLVLHGAGIQVSSLLPKKSLADFRRTIAVKLASLEYIYQAVQRRRNGRRVHYHLVTSAFSHLGNDGQADYGAANEALSRIAAAMDDPDGGSHWSSLGWLGWAGIGMTRGSEFAVLAASRGLRGITRDEGSALFAEMMCGAPVSPINMLLADGEIRYYAPALAAPADPPTGAPPGAGPAHALNTQETVFHWNVTTDNAPFLRNHVVNGVPTMPGAFSACLFAEAAKKMHPELRLTVYEHMHFFRFVRVPPDRGAQVRVHARVVAEDERETAIHMRLLSDFVHKSGRVLLENIVHAETIIRMSRSVPKPPARLFEATAPDGLRLPDPYLLPGSSVQLDGPFDGLREIRVGDSYRSASYRLADRRYPESPYAYLLPNIILVDAFWRFGSVQVIGDQTLGVYVPERCALMRIYFDYAAFDSPALMGAMLFRGANPKIEGDLLHVGPIEVSDANGNVVLVVEQAVCRKFGEVRHSLKDALHVVA